MISRRTFAVGALGSVAAPLVARAQQRARPMLGFLGGSDDRPSGLRAIVGALQATGWVEGRTHDAVWRFGEGDLGRIRAYAQELVALNPNLIVTSSTPAAIAVRSLTRTIPFVGTVVSDPIGNGLSSSFNRPDANFTGTISNIETLPGKILDVGLDLFPRASRIGVLSVPDDPITNAFLPPIAEVARAKNVEIVHAGARSALEIEPAIAGLGVVRVDFLFVASNALLIAERHRVAAGVMSAKLPAIGQYRDYVGAGLLMSYGPSLQAMIERGAYFVDRILRGAKIVELPLEFPTTFDLVVNLKAAKSLGLTLPEIIMIRATEVIE
jgi:putative tryptophan/tyrosine transport system substrate-binding protein